MVVSVAGARRGATAAARWSALVNAAIREQARCGGAVEAHFSLPMAADEEASLRAACREAGWTLEVAAPRYDPETLVLVEPGRLALARSGGCGIPGGVLTPTEADLLVVECTRAWLARIDQAVQRQFPLFGEATVYCDEPLNPEVKAAIRRAYEAPEAGWRVAVADPMGKVRGSEGLGYVHLRPA